LNQWFLISPKTYVVIKKQKMLLYQTENHSILETANELFIALIREMHLKTNLGALRFTDTYINDPECNELIGESLDKGLTELKKPEGEYKPIVLLPILGLGGDLDKPDAREILKYESDLSGYLRKVNLFITGCCNYNCLHCYSYCKQTTYCLKENSENELNSEIIEVILKQLPAGAQLNLIGGNINLYSEWEKLIALLNKYQPDVSYWLNSKYVLDTDKKLKEFLRGSKINILVNFPFEDRFDEIINNYENADFVFLIRNELDYETVDVLYNKYNFKTFKIVPVYTGDNLDFFENYVYLSKEDVFNKPLTHGEIFRNQKLNFNKFGILNILTNGDIKANLNAKTIGNVYHDSLLKVIYNELSENTAWRKRRNAEPCESCLYQYICPPVSNYESVIGKPNLCHINL